MSETKKSETKNMGVKVSPPKGVCDDRLCPFHGELKCRGMTFEGVVISSKMQKTASVEWERRQYIKKYERYQRKRTRIKAHNPSCIDAKEGDLVKIMQCRPLSKTKNFVIIELIGKERGFKEKIEAKEESKVPKKEMEEKTEGIEQTEEEKLE